MPVGMHATVPCKSSDTGYRTFDTIFAVETKGDEVVVMRYQHTSLRDAEKYHSEFGSAGFCRKGNYGMPRFTTNTMRVCVKDAVNVTYDATVPVQPHFLNGVQEFSDTEYCSDSPYQVPWTTVDSDKQHPQMKSVGNAPLYRGGKYSKDDVWPTGNREEEALNTRPGIKDQSWGDLCDDGDLLTCKEHEVCLVLVGCIVGRPYIDSRVP